AGDAIVAMDSLADLSLLEMMDHTTVTAVEAMTKMGLDTSAAALVIAQSDAPDAARVMEQCEKICQANGARDTARTDDPAEGKMLLAARRMALPALERIGTPLLDDVAVPKPALTIMFERI